MFPSIKITIVQDNEKADNWQVLIMPYSGTNYQNLSLFQTKLELKNICG